MNFLLTNTAHTALNALLGLTLALALVLILVCVFVFIPALKKPIYALAVFSKVSPAIAYAPIFLMLTGSSIGSKVLTAAMICFYPLLLELVLAVSRFPTRLQNQADMHAASLKLQVQTFGWAYMLEGLCRGLLTAVPLAVIGSIVADYIIGNTRPGGLGQAIISDSGQNNYQGVLFDVMAATILGFIGFAIASMLHKKVNQYLGLRYG